MELNWLSSAAVWLVPLVLLPILAHLVRRPPRERWFFGAMYLLQKVQQRNTTRNRIDDWWLLLLRVLLLLLLAGAIMRPEVRWRDPNEQTEYSKRVVLLVDSSLSMNQTLAPKDSTTVFEWSKKQLVERLKEDQGQRVFQMGVYNDGVDDVFSDWQDDTISVSSAVQALQQTEQTTDLVEAIRWARQAFEGNGGEIWLYTDQSGIFSEALKTEISLLVEQNVALIPHTPEIASRGNLAIVNATYGAGVEGGTLRFTIENYGEVARETSCTTTLPDGTEINTIVDIPALSQTESFVTIPRVADGGIGRVEVKDNRLTLDNTWYFQLPQIGANRVVLVDGDPGTAPIDSEVYFLERALAPSNFGAHIVPEVVGDLSAVDPSVDEQAVIVLANVATSDASVGPLVEYVRSGGGLFISLGHNSNISSINQVWTPLFPTTLKDRHILSTEYDYGTPIALPSLDHSLFTPFQSGGLGGFARARWIEVFRLAEELPSDATVLLELQNGLPLLIEYSLGKGRICLLLGSLDIESSNFPLQSVYMPFMQRLIGHLGGQAQGGERMDATLGDAVNISVSSGMDSLQWNSVDGSVQANLRGDTVRLDSKRSGAYQLQVGTGTVLAWVALNSNRIESNVAVDVPLLEVAAEVAPEAFYETREIGPWLILLALGLLLLQSLWGPKEEVNHAP